MNLIKKIFWYTINNLFKLIHKISLSHTYQKSKDQIRIQFRPGLRMLHKQINRELYNQKLNWNKYIYANNYMYQGWDKIFITGLRSTDSRIQEYKIEKYLNEKSTVLDIGCNTGFVSLALANKVKKIYAIDHNVHLINIGKIVSNYLGINNVDFIVGDVFNIKNNVRFDQIWSFASHDTNDKGINIGLPLFFDRLDQLLKDKGTIVFESHEHDIKNNKFIDEMKKITNNFKLKDFRFIKKYRFGSKRIKRYFYILEK